MMAQPQVEIGLVAAMALEIAPLLLRCESVTKIVGDGFVVHTGLLRGCSVALVVGASGAKIKKATEALLAGHVPKAILSVGLAGALSPDLSQRDIVIAHEIADVSGWQTATNFAPSHPQERPTRTTPPTAQTYTGRLLSVDHIVRTAEEKQPLHREFAALAVDMESSHVARICQQHGVPFGAVRVISDDARSDLPVEALTLFGSSGLFRLGAAVGALWNRPASVKELWRLRQTAHLAAARLGEYLDANLASFARRREAVGGY